MRRILPIVVLVYSVWAQTENQSQSTPDQTPGSVPATNPQNANPADDNSRKAKTLIEQAIAALGDRLISRSVIARSKGEAMAFTTVEPKAAAAFSGTSSSFRQGARRDHERARHRAVVRRG